MLVNDTPHALALLSKFGTLSPEDQTKWLGVMRWQLFQKGQLIQEAGSTCKTIYVVESGAARIFYFKEQSEVTEYFAFAGELIIRAESLLTGKPTNKAIEALEDCRLLAIDAAAWFALFDEHADLERLYRHMLEKAFVHAISRIESLQFKSATERYLDLLEETDIVQRIPLRHVASYLGITQVSLSRIRAEISRRS